MLHISYILTAPIVKSKIFDKTMTVDITRKTTAAAAEKNNSILSKFMPHMLSALSIYKIRRNAVSINIIIVITQNASHVLFKPIFDKINPTSSKI